MDYRVGEVHILMQQIYDPQFIIHKSQKEIQQGERYCFIKVYMLVTVYNFGSLLGLVINFRIINLFNRPLQISYKLITNLNSLTSPQNQESTVNSLITHIHFVKSREMGSRETWHGNKTNYEQGKAYADVKISTCSILCEFSRNLHFMGYEGVDCTPLYFVAL